MKRLLSFFMAMAVLAFVARPALATDFTIGNDATARTLVDTYQNFVIIDTNNPAAFTGKLTSFSYHASNTNHFRFVLVDGLQVKWVSEEITPVTVGVNTYTPSSPVSVNSGWNIGMYFVSTGVIPFEYTGSPAQYTPNNYGLPVVGATLMQEGTSGRTYSLGASGVYCTQTGFYRDGINMTAALINPTEAVSGDVNATGCNIGVYFDQSGVVDGANIYGSNYFGILAKTTALNTDDIVVDIKNSNVHNIGEVPFNGSQHGVAVYLRAMNDTDDGHFKLTGEISNNTVSAYQKGGIVVNGLNANVTVKNNEVEGANLSYITAANSVQFGWGSSGLITHNNIGGNQWCGPSDYVATALLLMGGGKVDVIQNNIRGNSDVGLYAEINDSIINNNKIFDEGEDCNVNDYDYGLGNWGTSNLVTNNKVKGFDTPYDSVEGGKNKSIQGPQKINPWF